MLTYVVTTDRAALLDFCEHAGVHQRCTRLVQTPADLAGANLGENTLVFWGDYARLPKLAGIVTVAQSQVLEDIAKTEERLPAARRARTGR